MKEPQESELSRARREAAEALAERDNLREQLNRIIKAVEPWRAWAFNESNERATLIARLKRLEADYSEVTQERNYWRGEIETIQTRIQAAIENLPWVIKLNKPVPAVPPDEPENQPVSVPREPGDSF